MTDSPIPSDRLEFSESLTALIERAHNAGVDVEGAWKCTIDGNGHDYWDVQITPVEYPD